MHLDGSDTAHSGIVASPCRRPHKDAPPQEELYAPIEWRAAAEYERHPLRDAPRRSPGSRSTGPRCATRSGRRRWPSCATPSPAPATTPRSARSSSPAPATRRSAPAATSGSAATTATSATTRSPSRASAASTSATCTSRSAALPKPVLAAVAGYAVGGGQILHLVCDLSIAADNARLRPDRAAGRQLRRRLRRRPAGARRRRPQGEGDLVSVPALRRRRGARDGARQRGRAARRARARVRSPGAARWPRSRRSRCAC